MSAQHNHNHYHSHNHENHVSTPLTKGGFLVVKLKEYLPLILILAFSLLFALLQTYTSNLASTKAMPLFMGYFFCFLAMFKFFDLKGFVDGFETYDLITLRFRSYGYLYPFMELFLGVSYLVSFNPTTTNYITLLVMLIGTAGVVKKVLSGSKIKCACLGTSLNVPLTYVSMLENLGMASMALSMLLISPGF